MRRFFSRLDHCGPFYRVDASGSSFGVFVVLGVGLCEQVGRIRACLPRWRSIFGELCLLRAW
jgi:hypothetical protein